MRLHECALFLSTSTFSFARIVSYGAKRTCMTAQHHFRLQFHFQAFGLIFFAVVCLQFCMCLFCFYVIRALFRLTVLVLDDSR